MKPLAENKKAYFDYLISETFEAGIALVGQEVKSIKLGRMSLAGSYVVVRRGEVFLIGASVPPYQPKNTPPDYDPERSRKLLLTKAEIKTLIGRVQEKGLTLVPLKVYTRKGKIKVQFGLARGKKKGDKREQLKKKDFEKERGRALKNNY